MHGFSSETDFAFSADPCIIFNMSEVAHALPQWGVQIESHRHGPGFRTESHRHAFDSLIYAVSGSGECTCQDVAFSLRPNTAVLLRANQEHRLVDRPRAAMVVFVVYFDRTDGEWSSVAKPLFENQEPHYLPPMRARTLRNLLRQMLHENTTQPLHFQTALRTGLTSVLLHLCRETQTPSPQDLHSLTSTERVSAALDFVAAYYYDHHSLADASRMARLSQRHFSDICRRITGKSYPSYLNAARVRRAQELLVHSSMSVSAIAFEVGYEELSTFYRAFRRLCGKTPSQIRGQRPPCR